MYIPLRIYFFLQRDLPGFVSISVFPIKYPILFLIVQLPVTYVAAQFGSEQSGSEPAKSHSCGMSNRDVRYDRDM